MLCTRAAMLQISIDPQVPDPHSHDTSRSPQALARIQTSGSQGSHRRYGTTTSHAATNEGLTVTSHDVTSASEPSPEPLPDRRLFLREEPPCAENMIHCLLTRLATDYSLHQVDKQPTRCGKLRDYHISVQHVSVRS